MKLRFRSKAMACELAGETVAAIFRSGNAEAQRAIMASNSSPPNPCPCSSGRKNISSSTRSSVGRNPQRPMKFPLSFLQTAKHASDRTETKRSPAPLFLFSVPAPRAPVGRGKVTRLLRSRLHWPRARTRAFRTNRTHEPRNLRESHLRQF